jgi:Flp pilus assembly protein TadD
MRHVLPYLLAIVAAAGSGCASAHPAGHIQTPQAVAGEGGGPEAAETPPGADADLAARIGQTRELSRRAQTRATNAQDAEHWSAELAEAAARHTAAPTAENELALAQTLAGLGIRDQAYDHFAHVTRLSPRTSAAWEGLARIWRDWGTPGLGLGDAYRAVAADPQSPLARNTLGTLLECLGHGQDARTQFAKTLAVDGSAAYAQNNLCYSWLLEARAEAALPHCRLALAADPGSATARNNLALAMALGGDVDGAARLFAEVGGEFASQYNLGIIYLSQGRYEAAADAFDHAARLQPAVRLARARAEQARQLAAYAHDGGRENHERR